MMFSHMAGILLVHYLLQYKWEFVVHSYLLSLIFKEIVVRLFSNHLMLIHWNIAHLINKILQIPISCEMDSQQQIHLLACFLQSQTININATYEQWTENSGM